MFDFSTMIEHLFVPGAPILEKILRPVAIYAFLIIGIRLAGKRTMASLNAFDLVVIMSISNTVQNAKMCIRDSCASDQRSMPGFATAPGGRGRVWPAECIQQGLSLIHI